MILQFSDFKYPPL